MLVNNDDNIKVVFLNDGQSYFMELHNDNGLGNLIPQNECEC